MFPALGFMRDVPTRREQPALGLRPGGAADVAFGVKNPFVGRVAQLLLV